MPLSNAIFGLLADRHPASQHNQGVFYVDEDGIVYLSDGDTWLEVGGGTPAPPPLGFRVASAIGGNPYVATMAANASNQAALQGGQHTLVIPAQTLDTAVTIYASFPAPYVARGAYADELRLKEQLIIQDTEGFTTVGGLPVYDAETREAVAYPAEGTLNPDLNTFMRGHGFQGQYHTFELPAGETTTLQFDINWQLSDDGTDATFNIVDGLDNPARRVSAIGVPVA